MCQAVDHKDHRVEIDNIIIEIVAVQEGSQIFLKVRELIHNKLQQASLHKSKTVI